MKAKPKSAKAASATEKRYDGFTAEEKSAMRDRVQEQKLSARRGDEESAVLEKIAELPEADRVLAKRVHAIIKASAPSLSPKLWYGMPAYTKDGKIVCFFQGAYKFKTRYAELGFNDAAKLDDGSIWPVAYALTKLTGPEEAKIVGLLKKAVG